MKKFLKLWLILLPLIITGCRTTKIEKEIILPTKPQRQEIKSPETWQDVAEILNYYEHLVQEYEVWADTVKKMIDE